MALLFADLDDFKLINDSFGHAIGDRLLRAIAERLRGLRAGRATWSPGSAATSSRCCWTTAPADAELIGHRMLAALREPFLIDGHTIGGRRAASAWSLPEPADADLSADTLLRRADAAMYASKRRGKGTIARYAGSADGGPHADLPHLLARALSGDPAAAGFEVYYQPIVRFADGATVAVEALARWTDPVAGPVDPDVFVTVAERTGLVARDRRLRARPGVRGRGGAGQRLRPPDRRARQRVRGPARPARASRRRCSRALERHAVRPSRLVVEITETRRIPDLPRRGRRSPAGCARYGVRIALDDFGSGYNALAQLHSLPVDIVKLDSTLTDVDVAPDRAGALCRSVLAICAELGVVGGRRGDRDGAAGARDGRAGLPARPGLPVRPAGAGCIA